MRSAELKRRIQNSPPPQWRKLFAPVPGRSSKTRCLLCGRVGYDGVVRPAGWQVSCVMGHRERCLTCHRPFVDGTALAGHQRCKLHHACCLQHTTVPAWANPFAALSERVS